ncbi:hypothetical protein QSJ18_08750 [Gordonia sp. ABSL1-1]|uniref:hypothetical protein n=1 Tax=Gordonia sp. ABSL1-1 TaxID=3053923 RepID=UPI0025724C7F|nr:hypothetical protein [Gordonia sp. ABSL1-1]MDL9936826.1 hypothetical protein [Gordonia sp. ABSL1-1]
MWLTLVFVILLAAALAAMLISRQRGRTAGTLGGGQIGQFVQGTLTVTGVSDRGDSAVDKNGERYCTLSGTIVGPETMPTEVYGTLVLGADPAPYVGQDLPVVYKPNKAVTTWRFGALPSAPPSAGDQFGPLQ